MLRQDISAGLCRHRSFRVVLNLRTSPVFTTARTVERLWLPGEIFDIWEVVFTEVEVHSAWKMVMRATEECSGNLGSIFLIVFVFSVALSRCETIHLCIYFVVFPVNLIHLSWHHEFSFFLTQCLGIVGNSTSCPSLNSSYGNCYGEPESGKNRDFLHRVCLLSSGMIPRFSTMYPSKYFPRPMGWSWIFQTNQVMFIIKSTTHLLLGLCWWTHSGESMFLIWSYNSSKSSWLETRNGCSNTKLLLADGWWYCRALVSVFCRMKPNDKLILKTVGWSAKIWLSCWRRLWGLMVERWNCTSLDICCGG